MADKKQADTEQSFEEWEPEVLEYDPEIDGDEEHPIRDDLLKEKEELKDVITRLKEKNRGDRKVRR